MSSVDMRKLPIVCLDLETTGLDVLSCEPIEIAMVEVAILETGPSGFSYFESMVPAPRLGTWDEEALEMHKASGLMDLADVRECRPTLLDPENVRRLNDRLDVETRALAWLDMNFAPRGEEAEPIILCGNNVGAFDLAVLRRTMPRLARRFYYRPLDVSAIKVACALFGWAEPPEKRNAHRALADCRESIEELRRYWRAVPQAFPPALHRCYG